MCENILQKQTALTQSKFLELLKPVVTNYNLKSQLFSIIKLKGVVIAEAKWPETNKYQKYAKKRRKCNFF